METTFRKVSAKERLPEKEDCYFVFTNGKEDYEDEGEIKTTDFKHCGYHRFVNTFQGKYFSLLPTNEVVTHWLEEIKPSAIKEGEVTAKDFEKIIKGLTISGVNIDNLCEDLFSLAVKMCEEKDKEIESYHVLVQKLQHELSITIGENHRLKSDSDAVEFALWINKNHYYKNSVNPLWLCETALQEEGKTDEQLYNQFKSKKQNENSKRNISII